MIVNFKKSPDGLIPAVIQDIETNKVLMLGYMNEQSLERTKKEGKVTFFSRSKQRLWTKGEESGNFLYVKEILIDCDQDTILIKADPAGPVCHTGADTCFGEGNVSSDFLLKLENIIKDRRNNLNNGSYTSTLFNKGINKIAQKVGEEAVELVIESKDNNDDLFKNEAADLLFHYLILLQAKGFMLSDIVKILQIRNSG